MLEFQKLGKPALQYLRETLASATAWVATFLNQTLNVVRYAHICPEKSSLTA